MVVDQGGADAVNLVGAHRCADAAAADCHAAIHLPGDHRLRKRDYIVGVIIAFAQAMGAEIDNFMPRVAKLSNQLLLQSKPAVICGNAYTHIFSFESSRDFCGLRKISLDHGYRMKIRNPKLEIRNELVWNLVLFDHLDLFRISDFEFISFALWLWAAASSASTTA